MPNVSDKIGPRKFSEKIALLNKKEQEGNAKFEEIIKEVQGATKIAHTQPSGTVQSSLACSASSSSAPTQQTHYQDSATAEVAQAGSLDSQEEIERVYENLIRSVDQEYEAEIQEKRADCNQPMSRQYELSNLSSQQQLINNGQPTSSSPSIVADQRGILNRTQADRSEQNGMTTNISGTLNNETGPLHHYTIQGEPEFSNINRDNGVQTTVNSGTSFQQYNGTQQTDKYYLSGQSPFPGTYASTSYLFQNEQQLYNTSPAEEGQLSLDNSENLGYRARVVSFGSASTCRSAIHPSSNHQPQLSQSFRTPPNTCQAPASSPMLACNQADYLKEPPCEWSRQKSSSDSALHVTMGQVPSALISSCISENGIGATTVIGQPLPQVVSGQQAPNDPSGVGQYNHMLATQTVGYNLTCCPINEQQNVCTTVQDETPYVIARDGSHVQEQPTVPESNIIAPVMGANIGGEDNQQMSHNVVQNESTQMSDVPGINIYPIDEDLAFISRVSNQPNQTDARSCAPDQSLRDSSLPDISNLKFATNSIAQTPEKDHQAPLSYHQTSRHALDDGSKSLEHLSNRLGDCAKSADNWPTSYQGCSMAGRMDCQAHSDHSLASSFQRETVERRFISTKQPLVNQQTNPRLDHISISEIGLPLDNGQGSAYDPASGLTNDYIMRSRSHSHIEYLARKNKLATMARQVDGNITRLEANQPTNLPPSENPGQILNPDYINMSVDRREGCVADSRVCENMDHGLTNVNCGDFNPSLEVTAGPQCIATQMNHSWIGHAIDDRQTGTNCQFEQQILPDSAI